MKILADQAVKMSLDGLVDCKEQFSMVRGSFLGMCFRQLVSAPCFSAPCFYSLLLALIEGIASIISSHVI